MTKNLLAFDDLRLIEHVRQAAEGAFIIRFKKAAWKRYKRALLLQLWMHMPYLQRQGSYAPVLAWRFLLALGVLRSFLGNQKEKQLTEMLILRGQENLAWVANENFVDLHVNSSIDRTCYLK